MLFFKNKKFVGFLLIILVLLLSGCGENSSKLESVNIELYQADYMVGDINVSVIYPVVSAEEETNVVVEKLNQQFQTDVERFIEFVADKYVGHEHINESFSYKADVLYNQDGMISIVQEQQCGDDYYQYAATYSLADGKKMSMGELLDMNENEAQETVIKQFGGIIQSYPDAFNTDAGDYISQHIDEVQYYRYSEGLGVFFPVGTIADAEQGVQEMVMQ